MHPILLKVQLYLDKVAARQAEPLNSDVIKEFQLNAAETLKKKFNAEEKEFRLYMSNVGRPTCQLQMEFDGKVREQDYANPFRDSYGDLTEHLALMVLKQAGVNVISTQQRVTTEINGRAINGFYDVTIDEGNGEEIWDIKSASGWMFANKFKDFASVAKDDSFGYVAQGYLYAEATGKRFGGWIVINKENGKWTVVPTPIYDDRYKAEALARASHNVKTIDEGKPFERLFTDEVEMFKRKPTGNRTLGTTCSFCSYKYDCWGELFYLPSVASSSQNPKHKYYTHLSEEWRNKIERRKGGGDSREDGSGATEAEDVSVVL